MVNKTLKDFIAVYDGLIPDQGCDHAIEYFKKENELQHTFNRKSAEGAYVTQKKDVAAQIDRWNLEVALTQPETMQSLFINLKQAFDIYLKDTDILNLLDIDEVHWGAHKIQKTLPGEGYHLWHHEKSGNKIDMLRRVLAYTLYLNDVEEGGETEFLFQSVRVKPKKGRICFFPAHFPFVHRGNPPLSGEKYIMTSWFYLNLC